MNFIPEKLLLELLLFFFFVKNIVMSLNVNFELEFAKIYPDFTKKLVKVCNDLTFTEVKICMYIRLNYSNKKILEFMDISHSTLSNLRSSIRKKLNLKRTQGLYTVITNL